MVPNDCTSIHGTGTHQVVHLHARPRVEGVDGVAARLPGVRRRCRRRVRRVRGPLPAGRRGRLRPVHRLHVQHGDALRGAGVRPTDVRVVACN